MMLNKVNISMSHNPIKIGIVGTGYISRGFNQLLLKQVDFIASRVFTLTNVRACSDFPRKDILTSSIHEFVDHSDIIVECSGDPFVAAEVVQVAQSAGLPVVTINTEFHITCGSYFVNKGLLTEAEGDQPGSLAALAESAHDMGFKPLVYGNVKGFLNPDPSPDEMQYWSNKQGISLPVVTAATDGTKVQAEQVFVANGLHAGIAQEGLLGYSAESLDIEAMRLAEVAKKTGSPISDYIIHASEQTRVFIIAEHDSEQQASLEYLKMGSGPFYTLTHPRILWHFEILKTIKRVLTLKKPLLNNSDLPQMSLAAIGKKDLPAGTCIKQGMGSFEVRGHAIRIVDHPEHVPIGLLSNIVLNKPVNKGEIISFDHIDINASLALTAWQDIKNRVVANNPLSFLS
jgi:predicted homoserine dehydrogenase-like protein